MAPRRPRRTTPPNSRTEHRRWPRRSPPQSPRQATTGPYGRFPAGPLSVEDAIGPGFAIDAALAEALGPRLATALAHAHMLVFHPRDAAPEAFRPLLDAGWSTTGLVTLSQIVAFLAYQLRVVAGLRVLAGTLA